MNPRLLIPIPALAIAIGWLRQAELTRLTRDNIRLDSLAGSPEKFRSSSSRDDGISIAETRDAALELHRLSIHDTRKLGDESAEQLRRIFRDGLAGRTPAEVLRFVQENSAGMSETERDSFITGCVHTFAEADPVGVLTLALSLPEHRMRETNIGFAFARCLPVDPEKVVKIFDRLLAEGSPVVRYSNVALIALAAQARIDPKTAVSRLISPEGSRLIENIMSLPGFIAEELRNPAEHRAFVAALRTEGTAYPDSPRLKEIRSRYLLSIQEEIISWPFEDTHALVEMEFTPNEKNTFVINLQNSGEPGRWADWVAALEDASGREHPISGFVNQWMKQDFAETVAWLNRQPEGQVRNTAVKSFAMNAGNIDPETAAKLAMTLPPGKDRGHALAVVRYEWRKKDPAAYAAFAEQNGLKK